MRTILAATLCGMMMYAPAMAQDAEPAPSAPIVTDQGQPQAQDAVSSELTPPAEITGKPVGSTLPDWAMVGPISGYTYFHRAGASLADQRADLRACRPTILAMTYPFGAETGAAGLNNYDPQVLINSGHSPGAVAGAGLVIALGVAAAIAAEQRAYELRSMQLNYENCMMVRGWSVMVLDDEAGIALGRLGERRLDERLETMVGAPTPIGTAGRQFDRAFSYRAHDTIAEMSLSLRSLPDSYFSREPRRGNNMLNAVNRSEERERAIQARESARREAERQRLLEAAFSGRPTEAGSISVDTVSALPEGSAMILMRSAGPTPRFVRMDTQEGDGADLIGLSASDQVSAFVVPAGDWRLVSLSTKTPATSHCLGAPVLRIAAGEIVFAGAFATDGSVDFGLDDARAVLAQQPHLAERLQAGSYSNGSTFECGIAAFATAYEIADAPFVEGYAGGSRALAAASE